MTAKAKKGAPPEPVEEEPTLPLSVEERRARVAAVRALDKDLERIENALLDAQARLPALVREVGRAREVIARSTAPVKGEAS